MPNAIWKGNISFGLLNVPVTLYSAENKTDISFRQIDSRDCSRVRYERINEETGEEVPWDKIVKGYEYDKGNYAVVDMDELKKIMPEATQSVDLETFVKADDVDLMYFDKPYFLVPLKKYEKGYVLLRESLRQTNTIGIAKVVIRTRGYLAAVLPHDNALILNLIRYPEELRDESEFAIPNGDPKDYRISEKELTMSQQLIESMTNDWRPQDFHNEYREKMMAYLDEKIAALEKGKSPRKTKAKASEKTSATNVVDMMDVLKKSIEKNKGDKPAPKSKTKSPQPGSRSKSKASRSPGASKSRKATATNKGGKRKTS